MKPSEQAAREGWIQIQCEGIDSNGKEFMQCDMYFEKVENSTHVREVTTEPSAEEVFETITKMLKVEYEEHIDKCFIIGKSALNPHAWLESKRGEILKGGKK